MNKQQQIRKDRLLGLCFWIHKGMRWSNDPASGKAWDAIAALDDQEWMDIVDGALKKSGIVVKK